MASQEESLVQRLGVYVNAMRVVPSLDERRLHLTELVRRLLGIPLADFEVESEVYVGRRYDLIGNLVLSVKGNLHWQPADDILQLKEYIDDLNSRRPQVDYTTIVTDGLFFHVYRPQYDQTGRVVELETIRGLNLSSPKMTPEQAVQDLSVVLSNFRRQQA